MNRSLLIHWLLTARAGSELNLIIMKLKQMINFKVRIDVSYLRLKYLKEMIVFENWIEQPLSKANQERESAINLAELYWQGLDSDFHAKIFINSVLIKIFISMGGVITLWIKSLPLKTSYV